MRASELARSAHELINDILPTVEANAHRVDETGQFPLESVQALRDSGLFGLMVPRDYGGIDCTVSDVVRVTHRLGGACLSTAFIFAMHCQQVAALIRLADGDFRRCLLTAVASGDVYIASITTEASGSSLFSADQPLSFDSEEGDVTIHRDAPIVTGGAHADGFLIKMRSGTDSPPNAITWCYASREQLSIEVGVPWRSLGMRGVENVAITLDGTITPDQIVAKDEAAHRISAEVLAPMAHLGWSAAWLGAAHGAFRQLVQAIRRNQIPRVTVESELVRHRLARLRMRLESASSYLYGVLAEVEACHRSGRSLAHTATQIHLNTLKVLVAEQTYQAANEMIELVGLRLGYGRASELPLERLLRDLRSASLNYDDSTLMTLTGGQCLMDTSCDLLGEH